MPLFCDFTWRCDIKLWHHMIGQGFVWCLSNQEKVSRIGRTSHFLTWWPWPLTYDFDHQTWPRDGPVWPTCQISCPYIKWFSHQSADRWTHTQTHRHTDTQDDSVTSTADAGGKKTIIDDESHFYFSLSVFKLTYFVQAGAVIVDQRMDAGISKTNIKAAMGVTITPTTSTYDEFLFNGDITALVSLQYLNGLPMVQTVASADYAQFQVILQQAWSGLSAEFTSAQIEVITQEEYLDENG